MGGGVRVGHKPSSVSPMVGDNDHSSRIPIARYLKRPTREHRTDHPRTLSYLVLLQVGFTKLSRSLGKLVSFYLTISPLPHETYFCLGGGIFSVALS